MSSSINSHDSKIPTTRPMAGAVDDASHCNKTGYPSCYSIGYAYGVSDGGKGIGKGTCPNGHSSEFCWGYNTGWSDSRQEGIPAPVNKKSIVSDSYSDGYSAGLSSGKSYAQAGDDLTVSEVGDTCRSHSAEWCRGFSDGYRGGYYSVHQVSTPPPLKQQPPPTPSPISTVTAESPHCDKPGYPSCYILGKNAGEKAGNVPCPSGHSKEYCTGWKETACSSEGCGGDYTCDNPNQPAGVPGCPNDKSSQASLAQVQPTTSPQCINNPATGMSCSTQWSPTPSNDESKSSSSTGLLSKVKRIVSECSNSSICSTVAPIAGLTVCTIAFGPVCGPVFGGANAVWDAAKLVDNPSLSNAVGLGCDVVTSGLAGKICKSPVTGIIAGTLDGSSTFPDNVSTKNQVSPVQAKSVQTITPSSTVDCIVTPSDPSCKTTTTASQDQQQQCTGSPAIGMVCPESETPPSTVDCTANPSDPQCTQSAAPSIQQPDCTTNPNDPACSTQSSATIPKATTNTPQTTTTTTQDHQQCIDNPAIGMSCDNPSQTETGPSTTNTNTQSSRVGCNTENSNYITIHHPEQA